MVCTTLNMDHRKLRTELSQDISKQLDIPVTTVAHIIQKFKVQGTVANLPGHGCKRKIDDKLKRRIIQMVTKESRTTSKEIKDLLPFLTFAFHALVFPSGNAFSSLLLIFSIFELMLFVIV